MAVFLEFVNVIVQKAAVARDFPGGLDGFAQQKLANLTEDEYLFRVGFMSTSEALEFVEQLESAGLKSTETTSPIAVIDNEERRVPWLTIGECDGYEYTCWMSAYPPGELALPEPGFLIKCSLSDSDWRESIEQCGAELLPIEEDPDMWRCTRGEAELVLSVAKRENSVVFWVQRKPSRRLQFKADVGLLRALHNELKKISTLRL